MRFSSVAILVLFISASSVAQTDTGLVWPKPPDPPRIRHIETIAAGHAFKKESGGFFSKLVKFVLGDHQQSRWMVQPVGIAVSNDGILYVADPGAGGVHVMNLPKEQYDFVAETKFGKFESPVGVAVAPNGDVYVADSKRGDVVVLDDDRDGKLQFNANMQRPTGLAITGGRLYVADPGKQKIIMYDLSGTYVGEFGQRGIGDGEFNYPISVSAGSTVRVVDALNYRVEMFDPSDKYLGKYGRQGSAAGYFASPKALSCDSDGNIYTVDALMDNLQIHNPKGELLLAFGKQGDRNGEFMSPAGIAFDQHDKFYVVDMLNERIQIFQYLK